MKYGRTRDANERGEQRQALEQHRHRSDPVAGRCRGEEHERDEEQDEHVPEAVPGEALLERHPGSLALPGPG